MESSLSLSQEGNKVCRLSSGIYVHVYGNTRSCSSMNLARACDFFDFRHKGATVDITGIDVRPYIYSNSTLLYLDGDDSEVGDVVRERKGDSRKYAWSSVPTMPWSWNEDVWAERLFHCIRDAVSNELQHTAGQRRHTKDVLHPSSLMFCHCPWHHSKE